MKLDSTQYIGKIGGLPAVICSNQKPAEDVVFAKDIPFSVVYSRDHLLGLYKDIQKHLGWDFYNQSISTNSAGILVACSEGRSLTIMNPKGDVAVIDPMDYFGRFYYVGLSNSFAVCSDSGFGAVLVFGLDGSEVAVITSDMIQTPYGVDVDVHGRVFIACARTKRVLVSYPPLYDDIEVVGNIDGTPGALVVHDSLVWLEVSRGHGDGLVEVVSHACPINPRSV